jgi:hypothetical protein
MVEVQLFQDPGAGGRIMHRGFRFDGSNCKGSNPLGGYHLGAVKLPSSFFIKSSDVNGSQIRLSSIFFWAGIQRQFFQDAASGQKFPMFSDNQR